MLNGSAYGIRFSLFADVFCCPPCASHAILPSPGCCCFPLLFVGVATCVATGNICADKWLSKGGTQHGLFAGVLERSPHAQLACILFAMCRQFLLHLVGVAVWVAVRLIAEPTGSEPSVTTSANTLKDVTFTSSKNTPDDIKNSNSTPRQVESYYGVSYKAVRRVLFGPPVREE
jgi:hypothetical protein